MQQKNKSDNKIIVAKHAPTILLSDIKNTLSLIIYIP